MAAAIMFAVDVAVHQPDSRSFSPAEGRPMARMWLTLTTRHGGAHCIVCAPIYGTGRYALQTWQQRRQPFHKP